jgi:rod shape-determining protein MreB
MKRRYNLVIGRKTAKALKEKIGAALKPTEDTTSVIVGRDVVSGLPIEMEVTAQMIYEGMRDDLENIGGSIRMILEKVPPELAKDIVHAGIYLTGGSSRIKDIADYFSELTNMTILTEEVGELARVMARKYGDQSFKAGERENLGEEMADVLWVLLCLANQTGVDLTKELLKSIEKKTRRDALRHIENPKLKA